MILENTPKSSFPPVLPQEPTNQSWFPPQLMFLTRDSYRILLFQGTSLTVEDFNNNLEKPWARFIQKNLNSEAEWEEVITPVLNRLALNLFVRESRWTWIKEQRERLQASTVHFSKNKPETLGEFLDEYNILIEHLVLASTMGHSPFIPQAPTTLEKHYVEEMSDAGSDGVDELNNLKGESDNFINRAMGLLHKL